MAKAPKYGLVIQYDKTYKGTSIGRRPITSTMNKNKRRIFKKYTGQGKNKCQSVIINVCVVETYMIKMKQNKNIVCYGIHTILS